MEANSSAISGPLQRHNSASGRQRRIGAPNGPLSGPEPLIAYFGGTGVSPPDRRFLHGRPGQRSRDAPVTVVDGAHSQRLSKSWSDGGDVSEVPGPAVRTFACTRPLPTLAVSWIVGLQGPDPPGQRALREIGMGKPSEFYFGRGRALPSFPVHRLSLFGQRHVQRLPVVLKMSWPSTHTLCSRPSPEPQCLHAARLSPTCRELSE